MKQLKILTIAAMLLFMFSFAECFKTTPPPADNPYGLPNATQTGANVFACRINGQNWILSNPSIIYMATSFHSSNNRNRFGFGVGNGGMTISAMSFSINSNIKEDSTYQLNDTTQAFVLGLFPLSCDSIVWHYAINGYITITKYSGTYSIPSCCQYGSYDPYAIISGTFNIVFAIPNCDTVRVTDGRFDINFSQY